MPVEDISMGGLLAKCSETVATGTAVALDLARPGLKRPLQLIGVVVDTRTGKGLGIRFDGLDTATGARLGELIGDAGGATSSFLIDRAALLAKVEAKVEARVEAQAAPAKPAPEPAARPATPPVDADAESKLRGQLQAQLRAMVMELGRVQELLQQRDTELNDARAEVARLRSAANVAGSGSVRAHSDVERIVREADDALSALGRVVQSLRSLP